VRAAHAARRSSTPFLLLPLLAPWACPLLGVGRRAGVVRQLMSVSQPFGFNLELFLQNSSIPLRSRFRRSWASTQGRHPKSARPLRCGPCKPVFQGRTESRDWGALISRPEVLQTVARSRSGGVKVWQIAGEIPWRRLGAARAGLIGGEAVAAAVLSGATVLAGGIRLRFGLAFFDLLGPLCLPRIALLRPVSLLEIARDLAVLIAEAHTAGCSRPRSARGWGFTSNGWRQWLLLRRHPSGKADAR